MSQQALLHRSRCAHPTNGPLRPPAAQRVAPIDRSSGLRGPAPGTRHRARSPSRHATEPLSGRLDVLGTPRDRRAAAHPGPAATGCSCPGACPSRPGAFAVAVARLARSLRRYSFCSSCLPASRAAASGSSSAVRWIQRLTGARLRVRPPSSGSGKPDSFLRRFRKWSIERCRVGASQSVRCPCPGPPQRAQSRTGRGGQGLGTFRRDLGAAAVQQHGRQGDTPCRDLLVVGSKARSTSADPLSAAAPQRRGRDRGQAFQDGPCRGVRAVLFSDRPVVLGFFGLLSPLRGQPSAREACRPSASGRSRPAIGLDQRPPRRLNQTKRKSVAVS